MFIFQHISSFISLIHPLSAVFISEETECRTFVIENKSISFSIFNYQFFQGDSLMIEVTKPRAIALGYFDGVHLGHRALMQRAVERTKQIGGTSAVFTFDVHPDSVVMGRQVPLLTANAYRTEEIKKLGGVDEVIFGHF